MLDLVAGDQVEQLPEGGRVGLPPGQPYLEGVVDIPREGEPPVAFAFFGSGSTSTVGAIPAVMPASVVS